MEREIEKMLVVSTSHITRADNDQLTKDGFASTDYPIKISKRAKFLNPSLIVTQLYEYGFIIFVGDGDEPMLWEYEFDDKYSLALKNLLIMARELGCRYLKVDRDGKEYEDLEKFEW